MERLIEEPENLVELLDIILSKICRSLKPSREMLANVCKDLESFGIDPNAPQPEKVEILIEYVAKLKDENGNEIFTQKEIRRYRAYLRRQRRKGARE